MDPQFWLTVAVQIMTIIANIIIIASGFMISWGKMNEVVQGILRRLDQVEMAQQKFEASMKLADGRSMFVLRSDCRDTRAAILKELEGIRDQNAMILKHVIERN